MAGLIDPTNPRTVGRVKIGTQWVPDEAIAAFLAENAGSLGIRPRTRPPVFFAVPCTDMVYSKWAMHFIMRIIHEIQPSDRFGFSLGALVAYARNDLVKEFLESKCELLMFIDSDILPPMGWTTALAAHEKHIISGLYHTKAEPYHPVLYKDPQYNEETDKWDYKPYEKLPPHGPVEVDGTGAGCLMVRRSVFEQVEFPWFKEVGGGEDFYFGRKATEAGFQIWADPEVQCEHISTTSINTGHWLANQMYERQKLDADEVATD